MYARAGKWKLIFLYVSTARKWNSKIGIDIYNSKMKIKNCTWQIESNVVYTYTETEIEKGESTMKNEIRYMIAGIGLALVGFAAFGGFIYTQIQEYNSMIKQLLQN